MNIKNSKTETNEDDDIFCFKPKDTNPQTSKRSNFRLNYNPYNLIKSESDLYNKKDLKIIRNMALEHSNGRPLKVSKKNSNINIEKILQDEDKKLGNFHNKLAYLYLYLFIY